MLVILLILVTVFRNDSTAQQDDAFIKYLYIYILSPITALDLLINQEVNPIIGTNGSASFPFLFTVLNIFGLDYTFTENPGWVTVPVFTNAYTAIWGFYSDFNWVGVFIFSIIMGWVWGIVYRLQQAGNQIALLFYSATCFSLIFQAFGDFFIESFSMDIQMLIYCIILSNGVKISPTNKNSNFPQLKIFK
nr:O-antigen polymerase [uncultured Muribaculum sp.]